MEKELVPTTPEEYRKGKTKIVRVTSNAVFEIRKMSIPTMSEVLSLLGTTIQEGTPIDQVEAEVKRQVNDPKMRTKFIEAAIYVVPRCVVRPPIVEKADGSSLTVDDLSPGDLFDLFGEVMDLSGLTQATRSLRKKFREQSVG